MVGLRQEIRRCPARPDTELALPTGNRMNKIPVSCVISNEQLDCVKRFAVVQHDQTQNWHSQRESNPCYQNENLMS